MHVMTATRTGRVMFVGAGPGAWDLLTIRAAECLRAADVIVHDSLVPRQLLDSIGGSARRIPVSRAEAAGGDPGANTGHLLVQLAEAGLQVVRLKGGDPTVFARLAEEIQPLRDAGIPVEFVPGVTAALAAAAAAGVPLTSRTSASSLTIITGHPADEKAAGIDFQTLAAIPGTLAVYMGVEQVERWSKALIAAGKPGDTPVTTVSRCSWPDQRIAASTLAACGSDFASQGWQSPAIVIVGEAAQAVAAAGPLSGRRVLVTRPAGQGDDLAALVRAAGGECLAVPVIRVEDPPSWEPLDEAIRAAATFDWIVFASVNGVRGFARRLRGLGLDARSLGTARLAAIGTATQTALEAAGFACDLTPATFRSEGLAAAFADVPAGGRFLLVRADKGRDVLRNELVARGHHVREVAAYTSRPDDAVDADTLAAIDRTGIDWVTVTSSSIAEAAVAVFGPRMERWRIASISPVTSGALARLGLRPTVEAAQATAEGLVAAMAEWEAAR